mmetsp:Transcript_6067/g.5347  ORF Transcript_6067/g.5347 Transcript_6067/m.5347 type:complete len:233 (-) Transcript_6067:143-841(-)
MGKGNVAELLHRVSLTRGNNIVLRDIALEHEPHALNIVACMSPIAGGVEVAKAHAILLASFNGCHSTGDLASHKGLATARAFVIEEDAIHSKHVVSLAVVHDTPVGHQLGARIGRARVKGGCFALLRLLNLAVKFGSRCLVKSALARKTRLSDSLKTVQSSDAINVGSVDRQLKRRVHVTLCSKVVEFVRLHLVEQSHNVVEIGDFAIMSEEGKSVPFGLFEEMLDTRLVEG